MRPPGAGIESSGFVQECGDNVRARDIERNGHSPVTLSKGLQKAALSLVPLLVDAPMYSFQATARPGQRRSSAKNPLHDLLLMLQDRREVD